jgi:hypothetical protein
LTPKKTTNFPSTLRKATEAYHLFIEQFPSGTLYQESKKEGGRSLYVFSQTKEVAFHTARSDWYTLKSHGDIDITVWGQNVSQSLSEVLEYEEAFLALLAWAISIVPKSIERNTERKHATEALLLELHRVFPPMDLDGGVSIAQAVLHDDYEDGDLEKMKHAYESNVTNDWRNVPEAEVPWSEFCYLDQKGWRYYLPTMIRSALRDQSGYDLFGVLLDVPNGVDSGKCEAVVEYLGLTLEQGRLVAKVLGYLKGVEVDYFENRGEQAREIDRWLEKFGVSE